MIGWLNYKLLSNIVAHMNSPRLQHISERQPITSVDRRQPTKRTPSGRRHASNGHIDEDSTNMGSQEPEGSSLRARATLFDKLLLAIKQWFQKHQVLIHSVQYVSSMAIVFIPVGKFRCKHYVQRKANALNTAVIVPISGSVGGSLLRFVEHDLAS